MSVLISLTYGVINDSETTASSSSEASMGFSSVLSTSSLLSSIAIAFSLILSLPAVAVSFASLAAAPEMQTKTAIIRQKARRPFLYFIF